MSDKKLKKVLILRDFEEYKCGEVAELPADEVEQLKKSGIGDPSEKAVEGRPLYADRKKAEEEAEKKS